jgi:hypothetical protein
VMLSAGTLACGRYTGFTMSPQGTRTSPR